MRLCQLIKAVSDYYGGDDVEWLREYAKDIVKTNCDDLGKAILCFESIALGSEISLYHGDKKGVKIDLCNKCHYRLLFCLC